jgi:hypothetical protein
MVNVLVQTTATSSLSSSKPAAPPLSYNTDYTQIILPLITEPIDFTARPFHSQCEDNTIWALVFKEWRSRHLLKVHTKDSINCFSSGNNKTYPQNPTVTRGI